MGNIKIGRLILYFLKVFLICVLTQSCLDFLIYETELRWFPLVFLFIFLWFAPTTTITLFIASVITKSKRWVKKIIFNILGCGVMFLTEIGVGEYIDHLVKIQLFPTYFCHINPYGYKFLKGGWALLLPYIISSIILILFVLLFEYFAKKKIFAKKVSDSNNT